MKKIAVSASTFSSQRAFKLAGTPLSEYTVVYAKEGIGSSKDIQAAKYADTVTEFIALLEKATGVRLTAIPDTQALPEGSHALLFGNTSLTDDNTIDPSKLASMGVGAYATRILPNGNVALAGSNACSALAAGEALVNALLGESEDLTTLELYGEKDLIHVACVGDSITYGTGSNDPSLHNYPVYLQRMLGYNYYVEKYGAPGHSLIETDANSFLKHEYFKMSTSAAPDVVIVMLGTNDCRSQKWTDSAYKDWSDPARKEAFLAAGQKLVDSYRDKNKDVQIIFATCPTVPQDAWQGSDWTTRLVVYGNPTIQEIAKKNNCPVIDIHTYSRDHLEMFDGGDGLHLQNEKYEILAQGMYKLTMDIIKK